MVLHHQFTHHFNGTFEIEPLPRAHVELKRYLIQFLLAVDR